MARYALNRGFHVVVEGILYAGHYGAMLAELVSDHRGATHSYYLDVPFEETLRRHATKPQEGEYGEAEMRGWYRAADLQPSGGETIISADSTLTESVERILGDTGLLGLPVCLRAMSRGRVWRCW